MCASLKVMFEACKFRQDNQGFIGILLMKFSLLLYVHKFSSSYYFLGYFKIEIGQLPSGLLDKTATYYMAIAFSL